MLLWPLASLFDPLHRLICSGVLEAKAARSGEPSGQRFAMCDITQGLFAPPPTYLIYDEMAELGVAPAQAPAGGSPKRSDFESTVQACRGATTAVTTHISGHAYVCTIFASAVSPPSGA